MGSINIDFIGYLGALMTSFIYLPQVVHTIKTKDTSGLSRSMYILAIISNTLWLCYGIFSPDYPILLSQLFIYPMTVVIFIYKLKYK